MFTAAKGIVDRFDVDGLELCFRDHGYFPEGTGRERQPLMTEIVDRISEMLAKQSTEHWASPRSLCTATTRVNRSPLLFHDLATLLSRSFNDDSPSLYQGEVVLQLSAHQSNSAKWARVPT